MSQWPLPPPTERQALALQMRRDGATYRVIGERLGVSIERARQLVVVALRRTSPEQWTAEERRR
jgi:hypothetical protein